MNIHKFDAVFIIAYVPIVVVLFPLLAKGGINSWQPLIPHEWMFTAFAFISTIYGIIYWSLRRLFLECSRKSDARFTIFLVGVLVIGLFEWSMRQ